MRELIDDRSATQPALRRSPVAEREWIVAIASLTSRSDTSESADAAISRDRAGRGIPRLVIERPSHRPGTVPASVRAKKLRSAHRSPAPPSSTRTARPSRGTWSCRW